MHYIGRWIQSLKDSQYPLPHELVGKYETEVQSKITAYLKNGHSLNAYRGFSSCLFQCNHIESSVDLTDGRWVWPSILSHYIQNHSVLLPPDFIADMEATPQLPKFNQAWKSEKYDFDFWRDWCNCNVTGQFRDSITSALKKANKEAENILDLEAAKLEKENGLSNVTCNWSGCGKKAITGKALCGRCCLRGNEDIYVSHLFRIQSNSIL